MNIAIVVACSLGLLCISIVIIAAAVVRGAYQRGYIDGRRTWGR